MIDPAEIGRRARQLRVAEQAVEKDYVLSHLLHGFAPQATALVFRGGTALSKVYWPDFRLSEDLDFICGDSSLPLEEKLNEGLALAAARTGLDLRLNFGSPREGWSRSTVAWNRNEVIVDVNLRERPYLETKREKPVTPYSDLEESDVTVDVISLREILGNKWYMLGDRDEPRDLFDVWSALRRRVPFADVASGHKAKYGYSPSDGVLGRLPRLKDLWEVRLTHQVADLPPFVEVVENITSWFRAWSESRQGA